MPKTLARAGAPPQVLIVAAVLLLLGAALALVVALRGLDRSAAEVMLSSRRALAAERLFSTVQDAETGQRGYLLTHGRPSYLIPYSLAISRLPADEARLAAIVDGASEERVRLAAIETLIGAKTAELARTIALANAGRWQASLALVRTDQGARTMDRIRAAVQALQGAEARRLAARERALQRAERTAVALTAAAALAGAGAALAAARLYLRRQRRAEELLAGAVDNMAEGFAVLSPDFKILAVNRGALALDGRPREALVGRSLWDVYPGMETDPVGEAYRRAMEQQRPVTMEHRHRFTDGRVLWLEMRASPLPSGGLALFYQDITARKEAERALRQLTETLEAQVANRTADLEAANAQLDSFASTVSHDLRAPLRSMGAFARILIEDHAAALGPEGRTHAARIVASAVRMERLVEDLLTFSRIQRAQVRLSRVEMDDLVRTAVEAAREGADPAPVIHDIAPLPPVRAERVILDHVLRNLVGNAVKFHAPGEAAQIWITAERREDRVRLTVRDAGIGIAPEQQSRIFGAFERLHGQEAYGGAGVGLAIVKTGVERMGGTVSVCSRPGAGAAFTIELAAA